MFSALKEGVFEPKVAIEYTDNEIGFGEDGLGQGRVVREEVRGGVDAPGGQRNTFAKVMVRGGVLIIVHRGVL